MTALAETCRTGIIHQGHHCQVATTVAVATTIVAARLGHAPAVMVRKRCWSCHVLLLLLHQHNSFGVFATPVFIIRRPWCRVQQPKFTRQRRSSRILTCVACIMMCAQVGIFVFALIDKPNWGSFTLHHLTCVGANHFLGNKQCSVSDGHPQLLDNKGQMCVLALPEATCSL